MRTKIILNAMLFVLMILAGCQNEEHTPTQQMSSVTLTAVATSFSSRTQTDEHGKVTWSKGDKMLVYGNSVEGVLALQGEGGQSVGIFTGNVSGNPKDLKWAVYPAENSKTTKEGAEIKLSKMTYPYSNSPMGGEIGMDKNVNLSHLCSMVRVPIENLPANAKIVVGCEGIAGTAVWNGTTLKVNHPSEKVEVEVPQGGNLKVDIPVFATPDETEKTFTLTIDGVSCSFKSKVAIGKLSKNANTVIKCTTENGKVTNLVKDSGTGLSIYKEGEPMTEDDEEYLIEMK